MPSRTSVSKKITVASARTGKSVRKPTAGLAVTPEKASLMVTGGLTVPTCALPYLTTMNRPGSQVEKAGTKVTTPSAKISAP